METGPQLKVSFYKLEKPGIKIYCIYMFLNKSIAFSFERELQRLTRERSGKVLDSRQKGHRIRASPASLRYGPWARHIYPSLVLVQPRKTRPYITERLLMGCKESNQTNEQGLPSYQLGHNCIQNFHLVYIIGYTIRNLVYDDAQAEP